MSPSRRHHLAFLVLWLSLILTTSFYAHEKAFWFDEILTLGIASTEPGPPMWQAMTAGFEFNPPLPYLAMHVAESLLGRGEFRSRLPFLLASWLAVLLLYFAFLRQGSPAAGLWAIYLWLHTDALSYFYEARSYAFVFLGATLLLVSWSLRRPLARTLGLYAGLLIALLAHMWALVLLPVLGFFVLEALWRERRLDWPPALALLAATPTLALYPPLVSATRGVRFLNPIYQGELLPLYHEVLDNLPFVLFLLLLTGLLRGLPLALPPAPLQRFSALLLAAPLLVFTGTRLSGSPFMERYVLLASLGAAMALAPLLAGWFRPARLLVVPLLALLLGHRYYTELTTVPRVWEVTRPLARLAQLPSSPAPVYFASGIDFLPFHYYATPAQRERLHLVTDRERAIRFTGSDGLDSALIPASPWLGLHHPIASFSSLPPCF